MEKSNQNIGIIQMVICAALWSIAGVLFKFLNMNAFVIAGARSLVAAATIGVYMLLSKRKPVMSKSVALAALLNCLTFQCFVGANRFTTSANAIVLQYTSPVFLLLFAFMFFRKKPQAADIIVVLCTTLGISVFFFDSIDGGKIFGNILGILAGMFMAAMFLSVGHLSENDRFSGMFFGHILCALIGLPCAAFTENTIDAKSILIIAVLGIFQLGIPYILFGLACSRCSSLTCSLIGVIEPLLNPVWVALAFNEEIPSAASIAAGVFIIASISVWNVYKARARA